MIEEGLELLDSFFTTQIGYHKGGWSHQPSTDLRSLEDLHPLEMFYASTMATSVSSVKEKVDSNMPFLIDKKKENATASLSEEDAMKVYKDKEKEDYERREYLKGYIDHTMTDAETQPLSRFLHRHIREKSTIERMKKAEDTRNKRSKKVYYVSSSFLVDGMYPILDGLHKRANVASLRTKCFTALPSNNAPVKWSISDSDKSVIGSIFNPVQASLMYEDNLQRLLLPSAFRFRETQKINPRGAILAYMAMFAHDHDPIVEIPLHKPTTLRGLFSNILDGTIYEGCSISSLAKPYETSALFEGDLKTFCDRALECSYYAVLLTFLGIKAWVPDRYPEDRFVTNSQGFVTIKMNTNEVMYDKTDKVWMFNDKKQKMCYVKDFTSLVGYLYTPGSVPVSS